VERVDSDYVYAKGHLAAIKRGETGDDTRALLKHARPATPGQFQGKLTLDTDKIHSRPQAKTVLKSQAQALENVLLKEGSISTADLQKKVPGLRRFTRKYRNLTDTNWITKAYGNKFVIQDGTVRLKNAPSSGSAAPRTPPVAAPKPAPKKLTPAERFKAMRQIYGRVPVP